MNNEFKSPYHPFTDEELEKSYWLTTHKIFIKRLFYSLLIFVDLTFLIFSAYKYINFYTTENTQYQQTIANLSQPNLNYTGVKNLAKQLELGEVKILPSGQNPETPKYDLIAEAFNQNDKFILDVTYQFIHGAESFPEHFSYILPGQRAIFAEYGIGENGKNAQLMIKNISYQRISAKDIPEPINYTNERLNFSLTNAQVIPIKSKKEFAKISFDLKNDTAYNYWDVGLTILLYRGDAIIGTNKIAIEKFMSGEKRPVEINWYDILPQDIRISVIPEIDVFDQDVYIKYTGTQENLGPADEEKN